MEKFQETLIKVGSWANANKYLSSVRKAFELYMPMIIIGAVAVLWNSVIVNDTSGLGAIFPPVMALSVINPVFTAINFCSMGIITLGITFLLGFTLAEHYDMEQGFAGFLAVAALITVTNTEDATTLLAGDLGSGGLFTGMFIAILTVELFRLLFSSGKLNIKLPPQVPAGVSRSFAYMIPAFVVLLITAFLGFIVHSVSGEYLNDLIFSTIQKPLMNLGGTLPGAITFVLISTAFWSVGLHGDNMISPIARTLYLAILAENAAAVTAGGQAESIVNWMFFRCFLACGGTGMMISLTIAILLVGRREENRAIAKMAIGPNCFNIAEINIFGIPVVLNPYLIIPFILAPVVSMIFGYVMTVIGFCPVMYVNLPWTMPPFIFGFLATGGSIRGGITQVLAILISILIYIPFVRMYEKGQAKLDASQSESEQPETT